MRCIYKLRSKVLGLVKGMEWLSWGVGGRVGLAYIVISYYEYNFLLFYKLLGNTPLQASRANLFPTRPAASPTISLVPPNTLN